MMGDWAGLIQEVFDVPSGVQLRLIQTLGVLLVLIVARSIVLGIVWRQVHEPRIQYRWRKATGYLGVAVAILVIGRIWFEGFHSLATYLGLVSAGLVLALRDVILDLAGWFYIVGRRPFATGDRVQIGEHAGDVIDSGLFQFTLLEIGNWVEADQSTGRIIHIPNGQIFTQPLANYTAGLQYLWNEVTVRVTFESAWRKAKQILQEIVEREVGDLGPDAEERLRAASRKYMIVYTALTPTVYTSVRENGVALTVRYLCEPRSRRGTAQRIWEAVLDAFAEADDIAFAYPTRRVLGDGAPAETPAPSPAATRGD